MRADGVASRSAAVRFWLPCTTAVALFSSAASLYDHTMGLSVYCMRACIVKAALALCDLPALLGTSLLRTTWAGSLRGHEHAIEMLHHRQMSSPAVC